MNRITEPLRLAVGSHTAGSGKGCAMNVVSWENGDSTITDLPPCADPFLAKVVQRVNDTYCTHQTNGLLCPDCSVEVLALAHRTVGTALDMPAGERARVYVEGTAVEEAESVLHLTTRKEPRRACALARRFLAGEDISRQELRAADAAYAAAAYAAADAAAPPPTPPPSTDAAHAPPTPTPPTPPPARRRPAAADEPPPPPTPRETLARAHRIIDRFEELTGVRATETPAEVTDQAYARMVGA